MVCARFLWSLALVVPALNAAAFVGTVTGADGKPLPKAMVILRDGAGDNLASVYAGSDGSFRLSSSQSGLFRVQFIGAFHENLNAYVLADQADSTPVRIEARLQAHEYYPSPNVRLHAFGAPSADQRPFTLQRDGTWLLDFEYTQAELVASVSGVAVSGGVAIPGSELRRQFNRIVSVLRPENGRIRIVFDPRKLPRSGAAPRLSITPRDERRNLLQEICGSIRAGVEAQVERSRALKEGRASKIGPPSPAELELAFRRASTEKDQLLRQARWLLYLAQAARQDSGNTNLRRALDDITPTSPFWPLDFGGAALAASKVKDAAFLLAIADALPSDQLRVTALREFLWSVIPGMRARLLDRMRTDFPDHPYTKAAIADYDPASQIRPGQQAPSFSIASLAEPRTRFSQGSISAKVYLIDFWATWCGPCVAEMPLLHRVYRAYHDRGFEILSVSLDESREVVAQFREARFSMPWLNAMDENLRAFESPMAKDFGVHGLPRAFLVRNDGRILAVDEDLRGERLEQTLARVFENLR